MIALAETITLIYLLCSAKPSAQGASVRVCVCFRVSLHFHYTRENVSLDVSLWVSIYVLICVCYMYVIMCVCEFHYSNILFHCKSTIPAVCHHTCTPGLHWNNCMIVNTSLHVHGCGFCVVLECMLIEFHFSRPGPGQSKHLNLLLPAFCLMTNASIHEWNSELWYQIVLFQTFSLD